MKDWVHILDGTDVKPLEHGAVYDAVQEMAKKLGLGHIPVTWTESLYPGAKAISYDNGTKQVRLNKGVVDATKSSLHGHATPELKAIIGHELAHLTRNTFADIRRAKLPLYIGPVAAVAAYQGYKAYKSDNGEKKDEQQQSQSRTIIGHLFGMNAQVGSWGLMGGMFTSAMMSRSKEFACDRIGAELTSPNAMKNAINMIYDHREKVLPDIKATNPEAHKGQWFSMNTWKEVFEEMSYKAHPFRFERINRLERMASQASNIVHEGKIIQTLTRTL